MSNRSATVHVAADGSVTRGVDVPVTASNRRSAEFRVVAAPPIHARAALYRGGPGVPRDELVPDPHSPYGYRRTNILAVTHPHDCRNHLDIGGADCD